MRLPNIITSVSDVLAGISIAGSLAVATFGRGSGSSLGLLLLEQGSFRSVYPLLLLVISTICLYGGGVVLNDVFDARIDKKERPERPIPSGLIPIRSAAIFGAILLVAGVVAAVLRDPENIFSWSAVIAFSIAVMSVVYDKWSKHNRFFGPLNMGLCRGLNLLLGISLVSYAIPFFWKLAFVPMIYVAAITLISRGEVHGGKRGGLYTAAFFYIIVILTLAVIASASRNLVTTAPFLAIFAIFIFVPLRKAIRDPSGPRIGKAVKNGVIALILLNASWAAAFNDIYFAILIMLLLPLTLGLAKAFAVT